MGNVTRLTNDVNIGVICLPGLENFLHDIVHMLEDKYNVQTYYGNDTQAIQAVIDWCDILWIEWANELCIAVTNQMNLEGKKVIVRLHSYEAMSGYCQQINWNKVDMVIFVAQHIRDLLTKQHITLPDSVKIRIIPNGVDINKFRRVVDG